MAQSISDQLQLILARRAGIARINSLSVFAIAPIPLLIHLGYCLGTLENIDLYQKHYGSQDWTWMDVEDTQEFYTAVIPEGSDEDSNPIALVFSISGWMSIDQVKKAVDNDVRIYEIQANEPSRDFLRSRKRLELFGIELRKILVALRYAHHQRKPIHVFLAIPAPLAIEFGRNIRTLDTPFIIYEYEDSQHAYMPIMRFNANP